MSFLHFALKFLEHRHCPRSTAPVTIRMREDHGIDSLLNPGDAEEFFHAADTIPFRPAITDRFQPSFAYWMAEFCRVIYRRERDAGPRRPAGFRNRAEILVSSGWIEERVYCSHAGLPQAALLRDRPGSCAVLVFRGTLGWLDVLTDMQLMLRPWHGPGFVHQGFKSAHDELWPELATTLEELRVPVFFTGHSLGAALALLTAARCLGEGRGRPPAALYTFGAPRVGDRRLGEVLCALPHFRVVNGRDLIPTLPPSIPNQFRPWFEHAGELCHLSGHSGPRDAKEADANPEPSPRELISSVRRLLRQAAPPGTRLPPFLADHAPINYVARLARAAANAPNSGSPIGTGGRE